MFLSQIQYTPKGLTIFLSSNNRVIILGLASHKKFTTYFSFVLYYNSFYYFFG